MITGQDSAPEKAAEAKIENDKGAMKDAATLVATKYVQEYYEKNYVQNDPNFTYANQGAYLKAKLPTETGEYTYSVSGDTLTVTDSKGNTVTGTINDNGTIAWTGGSTGTNTGNTGGPSQTGTNTPADTQTSYVGYYAYVDGVYGVIYADLLAQDTRSGKWGDSNGAWSLPDASAANAYKSYEVRALTSSDSKFGNRNTGVITQVSGTTGLDRFYIMEISNRGSGVNWATACSTTAGTNNSWRLPSKTEWSIFGSAFGITSSNFSSTYGLSGNYWSSTEYDSSFAWRALFYNGSMGISNDKTFAGYVCLCTTF